MEGPQGWFVQEVKKVYIGSFAYESGTTNFRVSMLSCYCLTGEGGRPEW